MPQPVLTDEKRNAIVAILSVGCPRYVAARYVGCSPTTIARTAARDPQFAARLRQAQAGVELAFLRRIGKAADKEQYWRAAAWALERMYPQRYARRDPRDSFDGRQVQAALEVLAELLCGFLPAAARLELRRRLARALAQLRGRPSAAARPATPQNRSGNGRSSRSQKGSSQEGESKKGAARTRRSRRRRSRGRVSEGSQRESQPASEPHCLSSSQAPSGQAPSDAAAVRSAAASAASSAGASTAASNAGAPADGPRPPAAEGRSP